MWPFKDQTYDDESILNAIRTDAVSSKVFAVLYQRIFPKVKHYILKSGGDLHESKDIFQDALLIFCRKVKASEYSHDTEIDGYLYTICRNLWINRVKIKNRTSQLDQLTVEVADTSDVERFVLVKEQQSEFSVLLENLGDRCKELLINSAFLKLSMKEIAEKMGFANENTAKTKKYKCKQRLLSLVDENPEIKQLFKA